MLNAQRILEMLYEQHSYATVQYTLPDHIADQIRRIRAQIPIDLIDTKEDENLAPHITIFYGLDNGDLELLEEAIGSLEVSLHYKIEGRIEVFKGKANDYKVLVSPIVSVGFEKLHEYIKLATGKEPPTFRKYKPHATIAYVKSRSPEDYKVPFQDISDYVDSVDFCTINDECYSISLRNVTND